MSAATLPALLSIATVQGGWQCRESASQSHCGTEPYLQLKVDLAYESRSGVAMMHRLLGMAALSDVTGP